MGDKADQIRAYKKGLRDGRLGAVEEVEMWLDETQKVLSQQVCPDGCCTVYGIDMDSVRDKLKEMTGND